MRLALVAVLGAGVLDVCDAAFECMVGHSKCCCNNQPGANDPRGRADYGTRCGRWDAADEKPWCVVANGACDHDETFSSSPGHYWSHAPCNGEGLPFVHDSGGAAAGGGATVLRGAAGLAAASAMDEDMHIVFSTSCNEFQHWQTEVLLNTAQRVGQRGKITHIIAGCEEREDAGMSGKVRHITHAAGENDNVVKDHIWRKSSNPNFALHYAPAIPEAKEFPWFNKPWSFYHWMKSAKPKERVIVLLDPDEFFLEALTQGDKKREDLINSWPASMQSRVTDVVQPGMAVGQMYGFGSVWMNMFDRNKMCGASSYCATIPYNEANWYYPVGPPYLIHQQDFKPIMDKWWAFMKPAYAADKGDIQVDMYAYIMAAADLKVKHVILEQYMVSCPDCGGEGWKYIDALPTLSCHAPAFPAGAHRPTFIHAAQHYHACTKGDRPTGGGCSTPGSEMWNFHKGHVPSRILECEQPLLVQPPDNLFNVQVGVHNRRNAYMICVLLKMVNDAACDFRKKYCPNGFNSNQCVRIDIRGDGEFPLARRICGKRIET